MMFFNMISGCVNYGNLPHVDSSILSDSSPTSKYTAVASKLVDSWSEWNGKFIVDTLIFMSIIAIILYVATSMGYSHCKPDFENKLENRWASGIS